MSFHKNARKNCIDANASLPVASTETENCQDEVIKSKIAHVKHGGNAANLSSVSQFEESEDPFLNILPQCPQFVVVAKNMVYTSVRLCIFQLIIPRIDLSDG